MARRALLVGINNYQNPNNNLNGCVNDVKNMWNLLKSNFGFRNDDIRMLVDDRATKEGIITRLKWMVTNAQSGDVLIFHYSGHGSQIRDRNGDELNDHLDELICPYDMNWEGRYIMDDDLDKIFRGLPAGVSLEVFFDCCHSGTGIKSLSPAWEIEYPTKARFLPPPPDIIARHKGEEDYLQPTRGFTSETRSTQKHIFWAGCRSDQTSADAYIDGAYNGAFTYYFCKAMRETGGNLSRSQLIERVRTSLRYNNFSQIPQLETYGTTSQKRPFQFPALDEKERLLFLTKPNMRGDDVKKVQEALAKAGFDIKADGVFGPYTRVVVMNFQRQKKLVADGVVGPAVRKALFG